MKHYRLSPEAQDEIEDIRKYLVKVGGAALARYVLGEIRQALRFLAKTPGAGHARDDLTDEPVKFWSVFSRLIIYDPAMQPLGIARILHANRDLETMFRHARRELLTKPSPALLIRARRSGVDNHGPA